MDFNPARGSEQAGRRPAVVVSNDASNQHSSVVIVAAVTSKIPKRDYAWNVALAAGDPLPLAGVILGNQLVTVAKDRLLKHRGSLNGEQIRALDQALKISLNL